MLSGRLLVGSGLKKYLRREGMNDCLPRVHKLECITCLDDLMCPIHKITVNIGGLGKRIN